MLDKKAIEKIKTYLFSDELNIYAIIDGAACPELRFKIYDWEPQSACLWSGELAPDLQEVAPYLVLLDRDSTFTDWLITQGWDKNWNIFATSELDFKAFRKQIRKLLLVKSPEGQNMVFRFYDPRVIKEFYKIITPEQMLLLFEGVCKFIYCDNSVSICSLYPNNESNYFSI
ncbi:DUF4123 domain-containing protein [Colwellia sp. MSW7]|uniref:DUF4123 domain-containing protein n=1 Tax=Colwellia maritima TaxID=2912588 RepID=A0ABS9X302_9GAMM|nr:DUF4123 domain-containing protein [Colwellia maritima]MCI2283442.1 DUF4123 domain-containing protein [Colwellia maritima]